MCANRGVAGKRVKGAAAGALPKQITDPLPPDFRLEEIRQARKRQKTMAGRPRPQESPPGQPPTQPPIVPNRFRASDAGEEGPTAAAKGKSHATSLLRPQELARQVLPADEFRALEQYAHMGTVADCGEPWSEDVIARALDAGPHVSALSPDGIKLIWDDIQYQVDAGFVRIVSEEELFQNGTPRELKISRVAVVPQDNRRDRIILNLSAEVAAQHSRRKKEPPHPSVNDITLPAEDQAAVKKLGKAMPALLRFMFETDCTWEILWQKIDLSDGFWRMIVETGKELNFVFQLPARAGDTTRYYVIPSSLQMGWKNSPAYFCTATDITRHLIIRLLALTLDTGILLPHRHDQEALGPLLHAPAKWSPPTNITMAFQVFVDDFMHGVAGPAQRASKPAELTWVNRAAMHGVHAVFPPPEVLHHKGGKDSISTKKVTRGDASFTVEKELLGSHMVGRPGAQRLVGLPKNKKDKYVAAVQSALSSPAHRVGLRQYQKILGKLQYASGVMPAMRGHFTPLNRALVGKPEGSFVGLGKKSELRETLEDMQDLLDLAHSQPSHITELVPPDLPHYYGTVDASSSGFGGVLLPCTRWLPPTVWRVEMPADLRTAVIDGRLTMVDCEFVGYFIGNCHLYDLVEASGEDLPGMCSHFFSDNSPTDSILLKQSSKAPPPTPARTLRWLARRQRHYRTGPQTAQHWPGKSNTMADIPSRSYANGFPAGADDPFLTHFSTLFPLPTQLASWRLVTPRAAICSAAFSLLRKIKDLPTQPAKKNGSYGASLPIPLSNTLTSQTSREPTSIWNESTCSWPLLLPCGKVCLTANSPLPARRLREHYASVDKSWQIVDLQTLAEQITPKPSSTGESPPSFKPAKKKTPPPNDNKPYPAP